MPDPKKLKQYAALIIAGINLKEGQEVVIRIPVEHQEFAHLLQKTAYENHAGRVVIRYEDMAASRNDLYYGDEKALSRVDESELLRAREEQARGSAYIHIISEIPGIYKGCDEEKSGRIRRSRSLGLKPVQEYTTKSLGQWTVAALPNPVWARKVFPDIRDDQKAVEALYNAIFETVCLNRKGNPVRNWRKHGETIQNHCRILNEYQFKALHFRNSIGTDLLVPLVRNHIWGGNSELALQTGQMFDPNIPTEEVFTTPDCRKTEGTVVASRPLVENGHVIDRFGFTFHKGKVVEYHAAKGKKTLESILSSDRGSVRLGEVALVPYDSPISRMNLMFYETLFDENAACHLALGASYPTCMEGGETMSDRELRALGSNVSSVHVDFMFGTEDLMADGITKDGSEVPVFRNGSFVF